MSTIARSMIQGARKLFNLSLSDAVPKEHILTATESGRVARAIRILRSGDVNMDSIKVDALSQYSQLVKRYTGPRTIQEMAEDKWFCRDAGIDYHHPPDNLAGQIREGILYSIVQNWIR